MKPFPCRHNNKILCGVVRKVINCPYSTEDQCRAETSTNLFGMVSKTFGAISLKRFRYNHKRIQISVLEKNMCNECKVIWNEPINCPICNEVDA